MESGHTIEISPPHESVHRVPRLSTRAGFWAVALAFLVVTAFSTAPSSLYGIYEHREHLSSLTITFVYAVYVVGVVASLLLLGHVSDWYGRRVVLLPAIAVAVVACAVLLVWRSLAGLVVARVLTGIAVGAAVATATALITDLDGDRHGQPTRRAGIVSTVANIGGLALGPLIAGVLARYEPHALTLPFRVFLAALLLGGIAAACVPERHPPVHPRPRYRPQRLSLPVNGRRRFAAACAGVFLCWAVAGLFAGLAGAFLAGPLHHPSPALCGLTIFLSFGAGVIVQTTTTSWQPHRLVAAGIVPALVGLGLLATSAWTSPPSLGLFLVGGIVSGAGSGAIFRGSLTVVLSTASADDRAGALATFFLAAYIGLSIPVLAVGIALQHVSPRVTLLVFAAVVGVGILAAAPALVRPSNG